MARKPKSEPVPSGPPEGPPPVPPYDSAALATVDVRLGADRTLAYRIPGKRAAWQGAFPDMGALCGVVMDLVPPPFRVNFVVEPAREPA